MTQVFEEYFSNEGHKFYYTNDGQYCGPHWCLDERLGASKTDTKRRKGIHKKTCKNGESFIRDRKVQHGSTANALTITNNGKVSKDNTNNNHKHLQEPPYTIEIWKKREK